MVRYVSTKGGISPVDFDEAVLSGFAADGGLFVPEAIPKITEQQLYDWSELGYVDLAYEVLSLFIDRSIIPESDLKKLLDDSFNQFQTRNVIDMVQPFGDDRTIIMELFHGPTLSFKDVAMGFLINVLDYLLEKRSEKLTIVLATTGDTGPAAAWASVGKRTIDCWPLYPRGMITEEQERQMTTLRSSNVHPVGVENCLDGGDDLDFVVAKLFADDTVKNKLNLSSVNSINWCRVMVQSVHYFYGYFRAVENVGDKVVFSVPSGAFGNLFGGYLARSMGLPVHQFICANNVNQALHTVFSNAKLVKKELIQTLSSAIDIVVPYNFWRYLYFISGCDSGKLNDWMEQFSKSGEISFDSETFALVSDGFASVSVSDQQTKDVIKTTFEQHDNYLLDPHTAVAVVAAKTLAKTNPEDLPVICLATAHPAKFPDIIRSCLDCKDVLPVQGRHELLEKAAKVCQHLRLCDLKNLEVALVDAMITSKA